MRQRRPWPHTASYFTIFLLPIALVLTPSVLTAQTTLELLGAPPSGGPSTSGPSTSAQTVTFYTTTSTAYSPTLTATYTLSNQQFSTTEGNPSVSGTSFGTNIQASNNNNAATNLAVANANYGFMNAISGNNAASINPFYTECSTCSAGTGVNIATNNSIWLLNSSDALINALGASTHALNDRVQFADLTITFSQPVDNPVVHLTGLGGFYQYNTTIPVGGTVTNYTQGFTTDVDLITSGLTWTKLSGNAVMNVTSTQISNTSTRFGTATLGTTALGITRTAASGSVVVNGMGITAFTMRLYLRGDGGIVQNNAGTVVAANNSNDLQWSSQLNHTPSGQSANIINAFSGDAFLVGLSLLPPPCDTTLTVSNPTICEGSTVNLFAQASGVKGTLTYSTDGTTWAALINPTNVTPSVSKTYFIKDSLQFGCFDIDTLQITVNQPVTAGVGTNPAVATCQAGSGLADINLAAQITGATTGGTWSQTSGTAVGTALNTTTGVFNPNRMPVGTYVFRYSVTGTSPCPTDTEDITITIETCCRPSLCIPVIIARN